MTAMILDVLMGLVSVASVLVIMLAMIGFIFLLVAIVVECTWRTVKKVYDISYVFAALDHYKKIKPYNKNKE